MKKTVSRLGSAALCVTLSLALGCGCAVMPPASSEKPASSAVSVPTDAEGKPLYDAARLDDGRLRILYGYDNSGDCRTVLCGSKVLYQSARSENVSLLTDTVTGETNYWFRSWSDSTGRGGRRSALYDKDGSEVLAFDGEQSATIQNGLLVLQESRMVGDSYDVDYDSYGTCSVIDLATGESLPVPEGCLQLHRLRGRTGVQLLRPPGRPCRRRMGRRPQPAQLGHCPAEGRHPDLWVLHLHGQPHFL